MNQINDYGAIILFYLSIVLGFYFFLASDTFIYQRKFQMNKAFFPVRIQVTLTLVYLNLLFNKFASNRMYVCVEKERERG